MNPWEASALEYRYSDEQTEESQTAALPTESSATDPVIYPGLYSRSGFDMLSILALVVGRPNPKIDLGPIDAGCALLLCDMDEPDSPIVYASDAFYALTEYEPDEVIGRNCRFLQAPGGQVRKGSPRKHVDKDVLRKMRKAVDKDTELQVEVTNFKKSGAKFTNLLTMIPVQWDGDGHRYFVGFQVDKDE